MSLPAAAESTEPMSWPSVADLVRLTKPRLSSLVLLTVVVGFLIGSPAPPAFPLLAATLGAMALVVGGANAVNQFFERDTDALMERTRERPLPADRMTPPHALAFALLVSAAGLAWMSVGVGLVAAGLATASWVVYALVYTPLKRRTPWCTLIGAVPGAMPPVVGWAAARGTLEPAAWSLFAIVFFWQMPHFFAISRIYREQFAQAGFPILSVRDETGATTARRGLGYTLALVMASLLPYQLGLAGRAYLVGVLVLDAGMLAAVVATVLRPSRSRQRWVFLASLIYLTVLMALLVFDRLPPV